MRNRGEKRKGVLFSSRWFGIATLFLALFVIPGQALAAPVPQVTLSAPSSPLLNDPVPLTLAFSNTSGTAADIGYYPMIEVRLPAAFECDAACRAAISVENPPGALASLTHCGGPASPAGSCVNPVTGESVDYLVNETVMFMTVPTGTISPGQPAVTVDVPATMTASAAVGGAATVRARGIFALGAIANGTRGACGAGGVDTLCQALQSTVVTPIVLVVDKQESPASYVSTGPTHPRTYTITADVATGATVTSLVFTDTIPATIVVTTYPSNCGGGGAAVTPAPTSCVFTPNVNGGGSFTLTYASRLGIAGNDITMAYGGYVQEFTLNNPASPVIDPETGNTTSTTNTVNAAYNFGATPLNASDVVTIQQPSLTSSKSVVVADAGPVGNSPGDTLTWTVKARISDYFSFDDLQFSDTIEDGQTYVGGSYSVRVIEGASDLTRNQAALGGYLVVPAEVAGARAVTLDLSGALADAGVFNRDGTLTGADALSAGVSSEVIITYQTTIDEQYNTAPGGGGNTTVVDGGDVLSNTGTFDFQVLGEINRESAPASESVTVQPLQTVTKIVAFHNGVAPGAPIEVSQGDTLTYKITIPIPTGDLEDFEVTDFLPTPIFRSTDPGAVLTPGTSPATLTYTQDAQADTAPLAGHWKFTTSSSLTPAISLSGQKTSNSIDIDLSSLVEDGGGSATETIEFLFTVTATNEPMADDLALVNVLFAQHGNSAGSAVVTSAAAAAALETDSPHLAITKVASAVVSGDGSVSAGNFTGVDAGSTLRYQVTIVNDGSEIAEDVTLTDVLPTGLQRAGGGYNLSVNGAGCNTGALDSSASNLTTLTFTDVTINEASTCTVTYEVVVTNAAPLGGTITNQAIVTYASVAGGPTYSPESDTAVATVKSFSIAKAYQNGTSSDAVTSDKNLRPGEQVDFLLTVTIPEGTASTFSLREIDSSTGNPAGDFFVDLSSASFTFPAIENNCSNLNPALFNFVGLTDVCFTLNPTIAGNQTQSAADTYVINFGTVTNFNTSDAATESFAVTVRPQAQPSKPNGTYTNRARVEWVSNGSTL
ncbi:MAG: isopeptide-forming domain-containing fimbrial protein, partial [Deltaproteobacteria bacterium]|nr:isopeptide-forming domain-containing fimbrial protein [Deltaproteobacteria bacterium]